MGKTKKTFKYLGCITLGASIALVAPTVGVAAGAAVGTGCGIAAIRYSSKKRRRVNVSNAPTPEGQTVPDRRQVETPGLSTQSNEASNRTKPRKRDRAKKLLNKRGIKYVIAPIGIGAITAVNFPVGSYCALAFVRVIYEQNKHTDGQPLSSKEERTETHGLLKIVLILGAGAASACLSPWSCIYLGVSMTITACVVKRFFKADSKSARKILQFLQEAGIEIAVGGVSRGLVSALQPAVALFVGLVLWWIGSTLDKSSGNSLPFLGILGQEVFYGAAFRMVYHMYLLYQGHEIASNTLVISQFGNNKFTILETAAAYTSLRSMLILPQKDFVELLEKTKEYVSHGLEWLQQAKQRRDEQKGEQLQSSGSPAPSIAP